MWTKDLKELKSATFASTSYTGPITNCPNWLVGLVKRNFTRPVFTSGFLQATTRLVHFAEICFKDLLLKKKICVVNCIFLCIGKIGYIFEIENKI